MIKVYVKSNCIGSKKAEDFLKKLEIPYERINLSYQPIREEDVFQMMRLANSTFDIINLNSVEFEKNPDLKERLLKASKKEVISQVVKTPDLLSFPIALQDDNTKTPKVLIIGFKDSEWAKLEKDPGFYSVYENINKSYVFKSCCVFDEVLNDDINLLHKNIK